MTRQRPQARRTLSPARAALGWTALLAVALCHTPAAPAARSELMPLSQVRPGQRGEVLTVYQGSEAVRVPLEILEIAPGFAGPGADVILARLEGERAEQAGVVAGMSGSPVYVEGRLVGALAYGIGAFPKEALAGITPIESMLALETSPDTPAAAAATGDGGRYPAAALLGLAPFPEAGLAAAAGSTTPVAVAGLPAAARQAFEPLLGGLGLGPWVPAAAALAGGGDGPATVPPAGPALRPGDPVAALLVRGDVTVAATGTTTLVDGDRVLAMGHPLLQAGEVDLPMARAEVLVTVPSLLSSFKMTRVGAVVGAFRQDRTAGLGGRLGLEASMVPVTVRVSAPGEPEPRRVSFEIVRTPGLSPALLEMSLAGALLTHPLGGLGGTVAVAGRLSLEGAPAVPVSTALTGGPGGPPAALLAARYAATLYRVLADAAGSGRRHLDLDLEFEIDPAVRLWRLEEVRLSRPRARAGETVRIVAGLRDAVSGEPAVQEFLWTVPDVPAGTRLRLTVGDAGAMAAAEGQPAVAALGQTADPERLARALAALRSSRNLYLRVGRPDPGLILGGEALPGLPPSVLGLLKRDGTTRPASELGTVTIHEESRPLPAVMAGGVDLDLEVE